ncbi:MAG: nucleotidyl transferase AbiEii/AbiGii toxin family protein [Candidatus Ratteibacteria bacterium]
MHNECFPKKGIDVLKRLKPIIKTRRFILAGETAAAIQIGHRISEDLDFFAAQSFSTDEILNEIKQQKLNFSLLQEEQNTLTSIIENTKVSLFCYPYPFIEKYVSWQGISVASLTDIASMKVIAISQRGAKRDFVDMYFILRSIPFWRIADNMIQRFGTARINPVHIGKSLVYFHDAEVDPDPHYCLGYETNWQAIKVFFINHVQQLVIDLQRAKETG